jgi:hypothetical protein
MKNTPPSCFFPKTPYPMAFDPDENFKYNSR